MWMGARFFFCLIVSHVSQQKHNNNNNITNHKDMVEKRKTNKYGRKLSFVTRPSDNTVGGDDEESQSKVIREFQLRWNTTSAERYGSCAPCMTVIKYIFNINKLINDSIIFGLEWIFQATFPTVIFFFIVCFFGWVCLFALVLWIVSERLPQCLSTEKEHAYWQDAFALSWTTFSTVGYGHIYPALASTRDAASGFTPCVWIYTLSALESFVGILYAGICGAILFAKIYRVQSQAPIVFSKALTIRYGELFESSKQVTQLNEKKNSGNLVQDDDKFYDTQSKDIHETYACPVLEVMVANTFANEQTGGELVNVSLSAVVTRELGENYFENITAAAEATLIKRKKSKKQNAVGLKSIYTVNGSDNVQFVNAEQYLFNRVLIVEHILNEYSPLLKDEIRQRILNEKVDKGDDVSTWPADLNSAKKIRQCLKPFQDLVVTMDATSNSSATSVSGHEVYDSKNSIVVGYKHANVMYFCKKAKCVKVDFKKLDDIVEIGTNKGEDVLGYANSLG